MTAIIDRLGFVQWQAKSVLAIIGPIGSTKIRKLLNGQTNIIEEKPTHEG